MVVNGDQCFDWGIVPCTGTPDQVYFDLETHGIGDQYNWGDNIEGRAAGSLYDLYDSSNEGYDSASFGFNPIANIVFYLPGEYQFSNFWYYWTGSGYNKHNAVRAIYQNTIDYNNPPAFVPPIPDKTVIKNISSHHAIDLWDYSYDYESNDWELELKIIDISDWHCGISSDSHWIDIEPQPNWTGTCEVTIQVSDSLLSVTDEFNVIVVPVAGLAYLPIIFK